MGFGWNVDFLVYIVQRSPTQSFVFCQITYYAQYLRSIVDRWMDGFGASLIGWLLLGTFFISSLLAEKKSSGVKKSLMAKKKKSSGGKKSLLA